MVPEVHLATPNNNALKAMNIIKNTIIAIIEKQIHLVEMQKLCCYFIDADEDYDISNEGQFSFFMKDEKQKICEQF